MPELAKVFEDRLTPDDWRVDWEDEDGVESDDLQRPGCARTGVAIRRLAISRIR
jgi:hypothetical protein